MSEVKPKTKPEKSPKIQTTLDLKTKLLNTSLELLNEGGPNALSMREVARRAGCTHQAPYHYFEDRESILASLVRDGFELLASKLKAANELFHNQNLHDVLIASAKAYVGFALSHPGVFRIMFRPDMCNPVRFSEVIQAGANARAELDRLNTIVHGKKAKSITATILWSHVHGLACLLVDGPLTNQFANEHEMQAHLNSVAKEFANLVLQNRNHSKYPQCLTKAQND
jgi:AcrR family transcriptional regulator